MTILPGKMAIRSAWYTYTPATTGRFRIRVNTGATLGRASFGVWSGAGTYPLTGLLAYAQSDITYDAPGVVGASTDGSIGSVCYLSGTSGTPYYIQVLDDVTAPVPPATGIPVTVEVDTMPAMAGDSFSGATAITGSSGSATISTYGAGVAESGEPNEYGHGSPPTASVWRTFTPPSNGHYQFSVAPYYDAGSRAQEIAPLIVADLWTGSSVGALTAVANFWGTGNAIATSHSATARASTTTLSTGTTYHLRLYVAADSAPITTFDNIQLSWAPITAPTNDTHGTATTIDLSAVTYTGSTVVAATAFDSSYAGDDSDNNDLYWKFVAPRNGTYRLALSTSNYNDTVRFYDIVTPIGLTDTITATAGTTYYIQTVGVGAGGPDTFTLSGPAPSPTPGGSTITTNDNFANAYLLTGDHGAVTVDLSASTVETGEAPALGGAGSLSFTAKGNFTSATTQISGCYDSIGALGYVLGGFTSGGGGFLANGLASYDPIGDTWTPLSPMAHNRFYAVPACKSGKLYVFGGDAGDTAETYDIATDTWSSITAPPLPSDTVTQMTWAFNGSANYVYVLASLYDNNGTGNLTGLYRYDVTGDTYTTLTPMPITPGDGFVSDDGFGAATSTSTKIVYVDNVDGVARIYDIGTDTWTTGTATTHPVANPFVFTSPAGAVVLAGGYPAAGSGTTDAIQAYDITSDQWDSAGTLPTHWGDGFTIPLATGAILGGGFATTYTDQVYALTMSGASLGTVWFTWAPAYGTASLTTDASPASWQGTIDVYTGTSLTGLTRIATGAGTVTWNGLGLSTYRIRLYGAGNPADAVLTYLGSTGTGGGTGASTDTLVMIPDQITLANSPGQVKIAISNGEPNATVDFTVNSDPTVILSLPLSASGTLDVASVPFAVSGTGAHTLTATSGALSATSTITVAALATTNPIGGFVTTAPALVTQSGSVRKWVFQDTANSDQYIFEVNPNEMTSPYGAKKIQYAATTAIDGVKLAFEASQPPVEWQFSGDILTQAQYDALRTWRDKQNLVWITDHYNRAWLVYPINYDVQPKRAVNRPWRHTYRMTVSVFAGPIQPV